MKYIRFRELINAAAVAPYYKKREWIISHVRGKEVLDLGCIDHSLDHCLRAPDLWLHDVIKKNSTLVVGVDILKEEVSQLQALGYDVICADVQNLRLDRKFDTIVCGDLIEHVANPGVLLEAIHAHLKDDGKAIITTPNPFAINRFFNILADGWTDINCEHKFWICPQTMFQLVQNSSMYIDEFCWLETDYEMWTKRRIIGPILNKVAVLLRKRRKLLNNDFGVVLKKIRNTNNNH